MAKTTTAKTTAKKPQSKSGFDASRAIATITSFNESFTLDGDDEDEDDDFDGDDD